MSLKLPNDFDVKSYKVLNSDLKNLNDTQLKNHYLINGIKEGRPYKHNLPKDFDVKSYKTLNNDLKDLNDTQLKNHYLINGIKEGRPYKHNLPKDSNPKLPKDSNSKLPKDSNPKLPKDFDVKLYKTMNNDLKDLNDTQLINHYLTHGIKEGRSYKHNLTKNVNMNLPKDFDVKSYKILNSDLKDLNDIQLIDHYLTHGIKEGRLYKHSLPKDFNVRLYKTLNSDLKNLNITQLIDHYLKNGINEGRPYKHSSKDLNNDLNSNLPKDFDLTIYKNLNSNLPKDFDLTIYKNLNSNLPKDFDLTVYKNLNNDLNGLNDTQLIDHYLKNGIKEGRHYKLSDNLYKEYIKNHGNLLYNSKEINDISDNINYLLQNINLYYNSNINKYNYYNNNIFFFEYHMNDSIYETENKIDNKLNEIIHLIKNAYEEKKENMLIIFNKNISFKYLQYYNEALINILDDINYDIIELSQINDYFNFYKLIERELKIFDIEDINKHFFDVIYITKSGLNKIYNNSKNNINILNDCRLGFYSRPFFNYYIKDYNVENKKLYIYYLSSILWDLYYRVTKYWNKTYCINLGFDIDKRKNMIKYCNLLNVKIQDFFYDGILGLNLPNLNTLINMGIYDSNIISSKFNIKKGTLGLNITQRDIIKKSINNDYILLLEDDIYFDSNYIKVLDIVFSKYKDIDILYLGYSYDGNNETEIFNYLDNIYGYDIYSPKHDINKKINLGGMFGIILSKKALNIYLERFSPISNVSDILLCDIAFNIKNDFENNCIKKTNYNLKTIFIKQLFKVIKNKVSLTEQDVFSNINHLISNKSIDYLSKIKKINFKMNYNYIIKIYICNNAKLYYNNLINIILSIYSNFKIVEYIDENIDICIYTYNDDIDLNNSYINILINGEKEQKYKDSDIGIITTKECIYKNNIYFPQMFSSLWERRHDYKKILNNTKEKFCAYMYSYDLEYRVNIYNFVCKYKMVDSLGKSCNENFEGDRSIYNENETYNDLAVIKYSKYKFVLALENGIVDGYITEKLLNPLLANSIPIYAGPFDAFEIINKKRVIYVYDFTDYYDLLEYVSKVDNNDTLYNSIIAEPIFIGNINIDNYEYYLKDKMMKALGLKNKNILIKNHSNYLYNKNIDFEIKNFDYNSINISDIKRYLSDFINKDDEIFYENMLPHNNLILDNIKYYLINLDNRKDRYESSLSEFNKAGIYNVERFSAIKPSLEDINNCNFINKTKLWKDEEKYIIGATGCKMSHYEILKKALNENNNYKYICIFEDDIGIENDLLSNLSKCLNYIESNNIYFDILFLSSNLSDKNDAFKISNNLIKLKKGLTTTAQIFKYDNLVKIINAIEKSDAEIDNTYRDYLENKYCLYPMSVYQKDFYSDITNQNASYGNFHKKFIY